MTATQVLLTLTAVQTVAPAWGLQPVFDYNVAEKTQPASEVVSIAPPAPPKLEDLFRVQASAKPSLVPPSAMPRRLSGMPRLNLHAQNAGRKDSEAGLGGEQPAQAFQPSAKFLDSATERRSAGGVGASGRMPPGISSPVVDVNSVVYKNPEYPHFDMPKEWEYSLEAGDSIKSYSSSQQDVKLLTQVFQNITGGFYLDTHAWEGEVDSNTLLLELLGWRGLCIEPRAEKYIWLWSKFRKTYLFLGGISPTNSSGNTYVGFDPEGDVDQLSGHRVPTYPLMEYLAEMGGRKTIDFWALRNGGYEAEVLNMTLGVASPFERPEIGVIMVEIRERLSGRGWEPWALKQSRNEAEQRIFTILVKEAGFKWIGGLDPVWINTIVPRWQFRDWVFVNPAYFERRGIPVPASVKSAPPPPLPEGSEWDGFATWDAGLTRDQEIQAVIDYVKRSKEEQSPTEVVAAKAHRVEELKLTGR